MRDNYCLICRIGSIFNCLSKYDFIQKTPGANHIFQFFLAEFWYAKAFLIDLLHKTFGRQAVEDFS